MSIPVEFDRIMHVLYKERLSRLIGDNCRSSVPTNLISIMLAWPVVASKYRQSVAPLC